MKFNEGLIWIENNQLNSGIKKCYNPSIVKRGDDLLMAYRTEPNLNSWLSDVNLVTLDIHGKPKSKYKQARIARSSSRINSIEDPRLFRWRGRTWILACEATYSTKRLWQQSSCQTLNELTIDGTIGRSVLPRIGNNLNYCNFNGREQAIEKNWTPLVTADDELCLVHWINPLSIYKFEDDKGFVPVKIGEAPKSEPWIYSGGTPLVHLKDSTYVGLFHKWIMGDGGQRVYSSGWYSLDLKTLKVRILLEMDRMGWADKSLDLRYKLEPNAGWRPLVMFPGGLVRHEENFIVSYGWNDCRCALDIVPVEKIESLLRKGVDRKRKK